MSYGYATYEDFYLRTNIFDKRAAFPYDCASRLWRDQNSKFILSFSQSIVIWCSAISWSFTLTKVIFSRHWALHSYSHVYSYSGSKIFWPMAIVCEQRLSYKRSIEESFLQVIIWMTSYIFEIKWCPVAHVSMRAIRKHNDKYIWFEGICAYIVLRLR